MSTYTYRYIEILREQVDGYVWLPKNLPDAKEHVGETFRVISHEIPEGAPIYYRAELSEVYSTEEPRYAWTPVDSVEMKWEPVCWYSVIPKNKVLLHEGPFELHYIKTDDGQYLRRNIVWANNGGNIRDDYISTRGWRNSPISGRGLPDDVSKEVKDDISSDYAYDHTWATIAEWESIFEARKNEFEAEVLKRYNNKDKREVMAKLDEIYNLIKDPEYKPKRKKKPEEEEWEDTIEYLFEEDIWDLFLIRMEIDRAEFLIEEFVEYGYYSNSRIIYYLA